MMARLQMKFVFVFNALLYISLLLCLGGKQGMCANLGMPINVNVGNYEGAAKGVSAANPGMPININVGDRADAVKPSAHLEASKGDATYGNNHGNLRTRILPSSPSSSYSTRSN
ncbi:uncharacterized protein [Montipora capricornis]|uniref:uncharacterized protein isoform X2 n=1 Tax=Montipora capricornis TaxID=246305 RepID=UPI0035F16B93